MLDNISLQLQNFTQVEFDSFCQIVGCNYNLVNNKPEIKWVNLRIRYFPNVQELVIQNSIHNFFNAVCNSAIQLPVNHTDFDRSNMQEVSQLLSKTFNRPLSDFKLFGKFEYGVNIDTGVIKPFDIIERWQSYTYGTTNDFHIIAPNRGKPFQKTAFLTDYRIKAYDKGKQAELPKINLLRFEIVLTGVKKLRQLLKRSTITLQDLNNIETWKILYNNLVFIYDHIMKLPLWNAHPSIDDLYTIHNYANKNLNADLKKIMSKAQFQNMRRAQRDVYEKYNNAPGNIHQIIRHKIIEKYPLLALPDRDFLPLY